MLDEEGGTQVGGSSACHSLGTEHDGSVTCHLQLQDVFVFANRTDTFGLVMLEALACGTPVAAFPVQGPIDVVGDSAAAVLDEDLRKAALQALRIDRTLCRTHVVVQGKLLEAAPRAVSARGQIGSLSV